MKKPIQVILLLGVLGFGAVGCVDENTKPFGMSGNVNQSGETPEATQTTCQLSQPVDLKTTAPWVYRNVKLSPEFNTFPSGAPVEGALSLRLFKIKWEDMETPYTGFSIYNNVEGLNNSVGFADEYIGGFGISGDETNTNGVEYIYTESNRDDEYQLSLMIQHENGKIKGIQVNVPFYENHKWVSKSYCVTRMDAPIESE